MSKNNDKTMKSKEKEKNPSEEIVKKRKNTKRIIALTIFSMLLSLTFIGVAVFAALTQTVNITNTITISSSGQARTQVQVFEGSSNTATGLPAFDTTIATSALSFSDTPSIDKPIDTNTTSGSVAPISFSESTGKNWYGYKIVFTNSNASAVSYSVNLYNAGTTNAFTPNTQILISSSTGTSTLASGSTLSGSLAVDGTETVYIIFSTNVALSDLVSAPQASFDMNISVSA